ncbi:MAG: capsular polysaccharide synthesis protein [Chitinivibrionia bacterium]|nr:capsular polysaccharide synthesis protein [Chitinivibrionia bacterium]
MLKVRYKIVSKISITLKKIRAITSVPKQNRVAKKLDNYIADFLDGKIEKFTAVPKKPELVGKKIFWQYWHQGVNENTSKMVVECLNSVKKHCDDYEIILLTDKIVWDYVELPAFVFEKFGKNGFSFAKLANLVRLYLLSAYGGVWLDATIYLTKPIDEKMLNEDFFAFQRSKIPPPDADVFIKADPLYFSWKPTFQAGMLNSFMIAKPNNKIVVDLLSILLEYWKKEKKMGHYFFFQILFNRMMENSEWKDLNCEIIGDTDCHRLQMKALEIFDQKVFDEIKAKSNIHKLTYRFDKFKQVPVSSFFDVIANGKIILEEK